jgi:hypothetical protein
MYDAEYNRAKENYDAALAQWQLVRSGSSIARRDSSRTG